MLSLAGRGYALAMRIREKAYEHGLFPSWRPPVKCISVGNISWGGSGKTPICSWLLRWCRQKGLHPVLLTRGYRARPPHVPFHVHPDSPVEISGDEPLILARENPHAEVVVDPCRSRSGKWAWETFRPDLFILDDGLQHMAVQRDLDLVVLRPRDLGRDWNRVIPSGPWREGPKALKRASSLIINSKPEDARTLEDSLYHKLPGWTRPVIHCAYRVEGLRRVSDDSPVRPTGPSLLVSGVGDPDGVEASARQALGRPPAEHMRFPDHHPFGPVDWENISKRAEALGAECIVCTSKDRVKLEAWADVRLCTMVLSLDWYVLQEGAWEMSAWLETSLDRAARGTAPVRFPG